MPKNMKETKFSYMLSFSSVVNFSLPVKVSTGEATKRPYPLISAATVCHFAKIQNDILPQMHHQQLLIIKLVYIV